MEEGGGGGGWGELWDERDCNTKEDETSGSVTREPHMKMSLTLPPALAAAKNSVKNRMTKRIVAVKGGPVVS